MSKTKKTKTKHIYLASYLKKHIDVQVMGSTSKLDVSDIADGCVGVSLWFNTLEQAVAWGGADQTIQVAKVEEQS